MREPGPPAAAGSALIGSAGWRRQAAATQEAVLPAGAVAVSCPAPFGGGGLGRHLEEIVAALERSGSQATVICETPGEERRPAGRGARLARLLRPLGRVSPAWRLWRVSVEFDSDAARRLPPGGHVIGFNGTSLAQMRAARAAGVESTGLVSANPHVDELVDAQNRAAALYPIERSWATRVRTRNLREYELADRIYTSSQYVHDSLVARGIAAERLALFPLTPDPRFTPGDPPAEKPSGGGTFDVVYVGRLTVDKGVPLLVDAVRRLPHDDLRLNLIGGWKTRGMREFVQRAQAADPRIAVSPGDPLPALRAAGVYAHPAYGEGFGYAPAEALACGVPVLVSDETGSKDLIASPAEGRVLPTGDLDALTEALDASYRGELFPGRPQR